MKKHIHKFTLMVGQNTVRSEGRIHRVLHVAFQGDKLCLWAEVDTDDSAQLNHFHVVGTGFNVPNNVARHIGSVVEDPYVWHVYQM
ncbi:hypothetical protein WDV06_36700 [Streptomyces racemochromogenes]|uniref:DUF7352 domain-containing protein n=1 Tax=Streptomyces racemochromogenes TaxID=67353 RepID=A0ABW7PSH3_9ACTN